MLKCKEIIDLASNSLETPIPWMKRWEMKVHLVMCMNCNRYFKQLRFIQKMAGLIDSHRQGIALPGEARKRIHEKLKLTVTQPPSAKTDKFK
jgi:hypothetical protein